MSIDLKSLAPVFTAASQAATTAAALLPGAAGVVVRFVGAALMFGAELAAQGSDPVVHIERLHAEEPLLKGVENTWAEAMRKRFGGTP